MSFPYGLGGGPVTGIGRCGANFNAPTSLSPDQVSSLPTFGVETFGIGGTPFIKSYQQNGLRLRGFLEMDDKLVVPGFPDEGTCFREMPNLTANLCITSNSTSIARRQLGFSTNGIGRGNLWDEFAGIDCLRLPNGERDKVPADLKVPRYGWVKLIDAHHGKYSPYASSGQFNPQVAAKIFALTGTVAMGVKTMMQLGEMILSAGAQAATGFFLITPEEFQKQLCHPMKGAPQNQTPESACTMESTLKDELRCEVTGDDSIECRSSTFANHQKLRVSGDPTNPHFEIL